MHGSHLDIYEIFIMAGLVLITVGVIFARVVLQDRQMNRLLLLASKRLGGRVIGKGMGHPELRLEHQGIEGSIKFYKQVREGGSQKKVIRYSVLQFDLPDLAPFALHLCPTGHSSDLALVPAGEVRSIGDPDLDGHFGLRCTDARAAGAFFDAEVRRAIGRLRGLDARGRVEILILNRELIIRFPIYLKRSEHILGLGFMGQKILDGFLRASAWTGDQAPQKTGPRPRCGICQLPIEPPGQACPYCQAQVHPDCWQLSDSCPACGAPTSEQGGRTSETAI